MECCLVLCGVVFVSFGVVLCGDVSSCFFFVLCRRPPPLFSNPSKPEISMLSCESLPYKRKHRTTFFLRKKLEKFEEGDKDFVVQYNEPKIKKASGKIVGKL